ncbi:MAG: DUF4202 domain-containing protein [Rugosibacter sp.]|jgi:hypothetical protein|nr:DUF4202 domain-containing protein [Rugosibacter sp.]MDO9273574.1 DUF4202 domain-containing protein [Rugosibacter sp.]
MNRQPTNQACFTRAMALFDAVNREDPNQDEGQPKELLYSQRMSEMLHRYAPDADEAVQLAVRAQHIRRWSVPRSDYPLTKEGYFQWRTGLYRMHAELAGTLMQQAGYAADSTESTLERTQAAIAKRRLKHNPDSQLLEDVAGLVFIEHYMVSFVASKPDYDEEKWIDIIRKTWQKMSDNAHQFAVSGALRLPEQYVALITRAIS